MHVTNEPGTDKRMHHYAN